MKTDEPNYAIPMAATEMAEMPITTKATANSANATYIHTQKRIPP